MTITWDSLEHMQGKPGWRIPIPPTCRKCGYNLTGLTKTRCPECGEPFTWGEVRRRSARVWSVVNRLKHANRDAMQGLKIELICLAALAVSRVMALLTKGPMVWWFEIVVTVACLCAALFSMVLGAQVFNVRRVPPWARQYIKGSPPKTFLGLLVVFLGLILFASSILVW
jgi:hypothetical protein